ncbi:MAG: hypothetical protein NTY38_27710, partial [Acidobacteria bacterium]|nr:hypothetical protein [Acidobacteriota bacterium]
GAAPLLWLQDSWLGVRVMEAGGGRLRIAPDAGGLPHVTGRTRTPKGMVAVDWRPAQARLEVEIPSGVQAELVIPAQWNYRQVRPPAGTKRLGADRFLLSKSGRYVVAALRRNPNGN